MAEVVIAAEAVDKLKEVIASRSPSPTAGLRVYVDHQCHCGGLKYGMALAAPQAGDERRTVEGIAVNLDAAVVAQPGSASVDYVESALGTGFTLTNSEHACGPMAHG